MLFKKNHPLCKTKKTGMSSRVQTLAPPETIKDAKTPVFFTTVLEICKTVTE